MIKKPIVAANWKMYKTPQEGVSFVSEISNLLLEKENQQLYSARLLHRSFT